ncbi:MAG: carbonic anhydrase [Pseudomonadota bacterium]|nr:carbonic anhydrase [Pseudomonadota bacterium]
MIRSLPRRRALSALCGCGSAALAARLGAGAILAGTGTAAIAAPAATGQAWTADEALELLKEGNRLFLRNELPPRIDSAERRLEIARTQTPFAVLVSCSDSRVPPEALFGRGLGDLFIVRVAGNTVSAAGQGSIEYAVAELGVPLIVVMGHERCGAVAAALSVVKDHTDFPGSIGEMVQPILPAAIATREEPGDWLDNAVRRNVVNVVERLEVSGGLIQEPLASGKLKIVGARYDLDDGRVSFFHPAEAAKAST